MTSEWLFVSAVSYWVVIFTSQFEHVSSKQKEEHTKIKKYPGETGRVQSLRIRVKR